MQQRLKSLLADWASLFLHPRSWGTRPHEMARPIACDALLPNADDVYARACDVVAPPARVFRWLCQLRVAPYSYDWLDNLGRTSPRRLTAGLGDLALRQRVMFIFTIASFEPDTHLTIVLDPRLARVFGEVTMTYAVSPLPDGTRLLGRLCIRYPRGPMGLLVRAVLPLSDAIMMRKQLLNLKVLAEDPRGFQEPAPSPSER